MNNNFMTSSLITESIQQIRLHDLKTNITYNKRVLLQFAQEKFADSQSTEDKMQEHLKKHSWSHNHTQMHYNQKNETALFSLLLASMTAVLSMCIAFIIIARLCKWHYCKQNQVKPSYIESQTPVAVLIGSTDALHMPKANLACLTTAAPK
jgi:hypothetical protein